MKDMAKKALEQLIELNKRAGKDASKARRFLDSASDTTSRAHANLKAREAVAFALLAIESRLDMLTVFVLAAMTEEDLP